MNVEILLVIPNQQYLGITESKLDSSVSDQKVNINGGSILRSDRDRNGGSVACYVRGDLYFKRRNIFSNSIEHAFLIYLSQI